MPLQYLDASLSLKNLPWRRKALLPSQGSLEVPEYCLEGVSVPTPHPIPQISLAFSSSPNAWQNPSLSLGHSCLWYSTAQGRHLPSISELTGRCLATIITGDSSRLCKGTETKKTGSVFLRTSQTSSGGSIS